MIKHKSLAKYKRTRKHKRTAKHRRTRKHRRTAKQRRTAKHRRRGGDQQFTAEEKTAVINEFKAQLPEMQDALTNNINALDVIVDFYTYILKYANPLLKVQGFRQVLHDKMNQIESKESIWLDPKYRNENNGNLNVLKPEYFRLKAELIDKEDKYNKLYT
jgi:hypothetical protein